MAALSTVRTPATRMRSPRVGLALLLLGMISCDIVDGRDIYCLDNFVSGLEVRVQDSLTGAPAASGAMLIARDGAYADTAVVPPGAANPDTWVLSVAGERPGTYTVTVSKDGYLTWQRTGVVVRMDQYGCHPQTVELVALLQRSP